MRPIYKFIRSFLIGRDNSIIQIDEYEKRYQLMTFLKKLSNVLFIASLILYIPEVDYYYYKLPLINKINKNNLIIFILIIGFLILYKSKNIM